MCKITTVEIEKELHLKIRELSDASGMKVKKGCISQKLNLFLAKAQSGNSMKSLDFIANFLRKVFSWRFPISSGPGIFDFARCERISYPLCFLPQ